MSSKMNAAVESTQDSITLDAVDDAGIPRKVNLRATIITPDNSSSNVYPISKQSVSSSLDQSGELNDDYPASRQVSEDKYANLLGNQMIRPPVNLEKMISTKDESTDLEQNVQAMVTNTVSFGWQLKERNLPDEFRALNENDIQAEKMRLRLTLDSLHPIDNMTTLLERVQCDKHACGNGYLEIIENPKRELVGLDHVEGHTVRLTVKELQPTKIHVPIIRPDADFKLDTKVMWHRFRRYAQVRDDNRVVWFKQAGDPRQMDWRTGKFAKEGESIPFKCRATSLIHFRIYHPTTPYGMPIWYGNSLSIANSRTAEEINYNTLSNNNIPSMMVIVENGQLTPGSIKRLREWTEKHISNTNNYSTFLILEGEAAEDGAPNPVNFRIRIERLKDQQMKDELFQELQKNNSDKIRQAFRLPPIFVGRADDYTRATADTSRDIADEQVFSPDRGRNDHLIQRFVLLPLGSRFHTYRSNHPNITDDIELIRLMAIAEKSGAMTPRRADRIIRDVFGDDIGPMPSGIDLDQPFSISFAQAQQGISGKSDSPGVAQNVISGLLDMRTKIEKELDRRHKLGFEEDYDE